MNDTNDGVSKVKIAVGAASLFLFLIGVKRTFRTEEGEVRAADLKAEEGRRNAAYE